jgi:hypothetical protein
LDGEDYSFILISANNEELQKNTNVISLLFFDDPSKINIHSNMKQHVSVAEEDVSVVLKFMGHQTDIFINLSNRIDELSREELLRELHMELIALNLGKKVWRLSWSNFSRLVFLETTEPLRSRLGSPRRFPTRERASR